MSKIHELFPMDPFPVMWPVGQKNVTMEVIESCGMAKVGNARVPVLHFLGEKNPIALNRALAEELSLNWETDETDEWVGRIVELVVYETTINGEPLEIGHVIARTEEGDVPFRRS